MSLIWSYKRTK